MESMMEDLKSSIKRTSTGDYKYSNKNILEDVEVCDDDTDTVDYQEEYEYENDFLKARLKGEDKDTEVVYELDIEEVIMYAKDDFKIDIQKISLKKEDEYYELLYNLIFYSYLKKFTIEVKKQIAHLFRDVLKIIQIQKDNAPTYFEKFVSFISNTSTQSCLSTINLKQRIMNLLESNSGTSTVLENVTSSSKFSKIVMPFLKMNNVFRQVSPVDNVRIASVSQSFSKTSNCKTLLLTFEKPIWLRVELKQVSSGSKQAFDILSVQKDDFNVLKKKIIESIEFDKIELQLHDSCSIGKYQKSLNVLKLLEKNDNLRSNIGDFNEIYMKNASSGGDLYVTANNISILNLKNNSENRHSMKLFPIIYNRLDGNDFHSFVNTVVIHMNSN